MKENKGMIQEVWKMSILHPKTSKQFYHHIQFRKSTMNRRRFIKKIVLKNFAIFTEKQLCWNLFFDKNADLHACNFIKRYSATQVFLDNIAKFLRTAIFKNICERVVLRGFPFMLVWTFPTWTNNISHLDKNKPKKIHSKTQLDEKNLTFFMMFFIILFFSISTLHIRRHLLYIIKDDCSEGF